MSDSAMPLATIATAWCMTVSLYKIGNRIAVPTGCHKPKQAGAHEQQGPCDTGYGNPWIGYLHRCPFVAQEPVIPYSRPP